MRDLQQHTRPEPATEENDVGHINTWDLLALYLVNTLMTATERSFRATTMCFSCSYLLFWIQLESTLQFYSPVIYHAITQFSLFSEVTY